MGAAERRKGARAQTEAAKAFAEATGLPARNGAANGVKSGDDMIVPGLDVRIEVKRVEQAALATWLRQAKQDATDGTPSIVLWRSNRSPWVAIVTVDDLPEAARRIAEAIQGTNA